MQGQNTRLKHILLTKTPQGAQCKNRNHGRPVVATHSAKTHILDKYITALTGPLLARIPSSLRDTGDFLKNLPKVGKENTRIATADVIGLYPNIPWDEGVKASTSFYEQNLYWLKTVVEVIENLKPPPEKGIFEEILKLILHNSYITFKNTRFFKQIQGTAMGMCISVFFANAYMYFLTKDYVHHPPKGISTFLRYIDDLIVITDRISEEELNRFFAEISNSHIKYTIEKRKGANPS